ncbi:hypothetical protein BC332_15247 [Capsicum chinense]|nr:hypothetical protein BC332_15247 [Capsicum chinense]
MEEEAWVAMITYHVGGARNASEVLQPFREDEEVKSTDSDSNGLRVHTWAAVAGEDYGNILNGRPYTFHNKPFIMRAWKMNFKVQSDCLTMISLWITLAGLPLGYWSTEALSKITSVVDRPLYNDGVTTEIQLISYVRILDETDVSQPLVEIITLSIPRGMLRSTTGLNGNKSLRMMRYRNKAMMMPGESGEYVDTMMMLDESRGYVDARLIQKRGSDIMMIPDEFGGYNNVMMMPGESRGYVDVVIMAG